VEVHLFSVVVEKQILYPRKEILLMQFYGARQEKDEDISHWSCRLERIIGKCVDGGL
jgi:hypothetical protein